MRQTAHLYSLFGITLVAFLGACGQPARTASSSLAKSDGAVPPSKVRSPADAFEWLERDDERVHDWEAAQESKSQAILQGLPLTKTFEESLQRAIRRDVITPPFVTDRGRVWAERLISDERQRILASDPDGKRRRVLVDVNAWPAARHYVDLTICPRGDALIYRFSEDGSDRRSFRLLTIADGKEHPEEDVTDVSYGDPTWEGDCSGYYYTHVGPRVCTQGKVCERETQVRWHKAGTRASSDVPLTKVETDPKVIHMVVNDPESDALIWNEHHSSISSKLYFKRGRGKSPWQVLRLPEAEAWPAIWDGYVYVLTNAGAPAYAILRQRVADVGTDKWQTVVPEHKGKTLRDFAIVGHRLALVWTKDVASELEICGLDGSECKKVSLPGAGNATLPKGRPGHDESFFGFATPLVPECAMVLSSSAATARVFRKEQCKSPNIETVVESISYTSKDGTTAPVFLSRRLDARRDGKNPLFITGYGGFGNSVDLDYAPDAVAWVESGGIYATVVTRGGGEYGEDWHKAAQGHNKQRTFDDFFAATAKLVELGWTSHGKIAVYGASNGGLIVGAAITQHPEWYGAAIAAVPLFDMLRFSMFANGATWVNEYGDPEVAADREALLGYSPYHHVVPGKRYPATLITVGGNDNRVHPMHGRKMAAALQAVSPGSVTLYHVWSDAGHGGAQTLSGWAHQEAEILSFARANLR